MFSQYEDRYVAELEEDLKLLRTQLAKANDRVKELENSLAYSPETGFIDLNKFAIEKKVEGARCYARYLHDVGLSGVWDAFDSVCEQLRKEQE